jgi:hypothetical protein
MPSGTAQARRHRRPAATSARAPITAPSSTVRAAADQRLGADHAAVHHAPGARSWRPPTSVTGSAPRPGTDLSCTFAPRRTMIGPKSARRTAPYQTEASPSTVTSPTSVAVGAIQELALTRGERPSKENIGIRL